MMSKVKFERKKKMKLKKKFTKVMPVEYKAVLERRKDPGYVLKQKKVVATRYGF